MGSRLGDSLVSLWHRRDLLEAAVREAEGLRAQGQLDDQAKRRLALHRKELAKVKAMIANWQKPVAPEDESQPPRPLA